MKRYNVNISYRGEVVSSFTVIANNYKEAMRLARFNRRLSKTKGIINVYLDKH